MNQDNFSRILNLLKKTGGKYIIIENDKPAFVIQAWEDYQREPHQVRDALNAQKTSELSEEGLIDKINREIALWKEVQDRKKFLDEFGTAPDIPSEEDFSYLDDKELSTGGDY